MKSRCEIWLSALEELGALCSVSTTRDSITVVRRIENEGESFFTKTLPTFAKDLERSIDAGEIPTWLFSAWTRRRLDITVLNDDGVPKVKKWSAHGAPSFLGGFMDIVFDSLPVMNDRDYSEMLNRSVSPAPRMRCTSDEADVARMAYAIYSMRQLCLMFSKEHDLCSDELVEASIEKYVLLDNTMTHPLPTAEISFFSKVGISAPSDG
jgi:hypothetical protein